jgi:hypothetical protein
VELVKIVMDLVGQALTAKAEARAEILARLNVAIENLQAANATEDAAHIERTAETRRLIAEEAAKHGAPQPTVLVSADEVTKP